MLGKFEFIGEVRIDMLSKLMIISVSGAMKLPIRLYFPINRMLWLADLLR